MKQLFKTRYAMVTLVVTGMLLFGGFPVVHAATDPNACSSDNGLSQVSNLFPAQYCSVSGTIPIVINILLGFLGIISVFFIILGGYRMVVSNGNEENFVKGRQTVLYAIIGLLVALFAYAIVTIVGKAVINPNATSTAATTPAANTTISAN